MIIELEDKEALVLANRHLGKTLKETAEILGIGTNERVRQIEAKARIKILSQIMRFSIHSMEGRK